MPSGPGEARSSDRPATRATELTGCEVVAAPRAHVTARPEIVTALAKQSPAAILERGDILLFPHMAFVVQAEEMDLLDPAVSDGKTKNLSYDSARGTVAGASAVGAMRERLGRMMERFAVTAENLILTLVPDYAPHLVRGRTSYRPVQISGRASSKLKDDARLHIDAFPSQPVAGKRILRVFANINPHGETRRWLVGEPFEPMAERFLPRVRGYSAATAWTLAAAGITKSRRTLYDHLMLGLHNAAKRDEAYQREAAHLVQAFPAGSTWICFTDRVMHAATAGQFALEQTFYLQPAALVEPLLSPLQVLQRMTNRLLI